MRPHNVNFAFTGKSHVIVSYGLEVDFRNALTTRKHGHVSKKSNEFND